MEVFAPAYVRKTRLCRYFAAGFCKNHERCTFAHGIEELQERPDFSRTRLCPRLADGLPCTDAFCSFAHREEELRAFDPAAVLGRPTKKDAIEAMSYAPAGDRVPVPFGLTSAVSSPAAASIALPRTGGPVGGATGRSVPTLSWLGPGPAESWQERWGLAPSMPQPLQADVRQPRKGRGKLGKATGRSTRRPPASTAITSTSASPPAAYYSALERLSV